MSARPSAVPEVTRLGWDSDYFGVAIGRLDHVGPAGPTGEALAAADRSGIECIYALVPGDDTLALATAQGFGFRVVDLRVTMGRPVQEVVDADPAGACGPARDEDYGWVEMVAGRRFTHSRFAADGRFPAPAVAGLFERWVARGFSSPDREVLVERGRGGFVIVGLDGAVGSIELIATAEGAPRGTGRALVDAVDRDLSFRGVPEVDVVTQGSNVPALRLYEGCGFRVTRSEYWLHRWRSEQPAPPLLDP